MNKLFVLILFIALIFTGCSKSDNKTSENKSTDQKQEVTTNQSKSSDEDIVEIKLPTIQCSMCKKNIETAVKKIEGVKDAKVNVKNKIATINFDKSKTDLDKIEGSIVMAGYQANDKPANKEAYNKLEACCKIGGHEK